MPSERLLVIGAALLLVLTVACSDEDDSAPDLDDPNQTAEELVNEFIGLIRDDDVDGLENLLSDAFILQRADGSTVTKDDYLSDLPEVGEFTVDDVQGQQSDAALVVSWTLTIESVIDGQPFAEDPAPRLSTFTWQDGDWRMTSHANFNVPEN
jgi:hypothetical protein